MTIVRFIRWPAIVFLSGEFIRLAGALLKIRHWPGADELLLLSFLFSGTGLLWLIIKLAGLKKE